MRRFGSSCHQLTKSPPLRRCPTYSESLCANMLRSRSTSLESVLDVFLPDQKRRRKKTIRIRKRRVSQMPCTPFVSNQPLLMRVQQEQEPEQCWRQTRPGKVIRFHQRLQVTQVQVNHR